MGRLVAMAVVPHSDVSGFSHFMDCAAVRTWILSGFRRAEKLVELLRQLFFSTVQIGQSLTVLWYMESHIPGIRLGIIAAPIQRVESVGCITPFAIRVPSVKEPGIGIK